MLQHANARRVPLQVDSCSSHAASAGLKEVDTAPRKEEAQEWMQGSGAERSQPAQGYVAAAAGEVGLTWAVDGVEQGSIIFIEVKWGRQNSRQNRIEP